MKRVSVKAELHCEVRTRVSEEVNKGVIIWVSHLIDCVDNKFLGNSPYQVFSQINERVGEISR